MKNLIVILLFFFIGKSFAFAQTSYQSHYVKQGETVFSITKQYNISEEELFRLNPEVKNGLKNNTVLIIPTSIVQDQTENIIFKEHKVKRKETLFGISQLYGVTQDDIKKFNKHLYSAQVKKGEEIKIPIRAVTIVTTTNPSITTKPVTATAGTHKVEAQETKFGISKMYGINVAELEALNPAIYGTETLPLGIVLKVPKIQPKTEVAETLDENYTYYTVKAKEGFYRLKVLFGVSEEEVIQLNPLAKDGLKEGMVVKIPKTGATIATESTPEETYAVAKKISLENNLTNLKTKNIVVFLPFELDKIVSDSSNVSLITKSASIRIALDFYAGVLIAADFAKQKGMSINLHVLDTKEMEAGVNAAFTRKNIRDVDAVLGPLRQAQVERVASDLQSNNIPVISPLSNRQSKMYTNFVQSIPSNGILENAMIKYLKDNGNGKNIILVSDATKIAQRQKLQNAIPGITLVSIESGGYLRVNNIAERLSKTQENWIILESSSATLVSSAVSALNGLSRNNTLRLFTLDKNDAFEFSEVSNVHLARLGFTYPSVSKTFDYKEEHPFIKAYKDKYGTYPNRFAVRGFDITYDMLLRLGYSNTIFESNDSINGETVYLENKFNYQKSSQGGYYNTAVYLLKYNPDLKLEVVQ
ncbi:MAG: LysM peptidoglycan-binding domain-containing protein [Flavobacteriales bacterium]|nr:LysM peptidoglycan-binding domain-containing protein [Flavobacteriales bacterium]